MSIKHSEEKTGGVNYEIMKIDQRMLKVHRKTKRLTFILSPFNF